MTRHELFRKHSLEMADVEIHPALKRLNLSEYSRQVAAETYIIYLYGDESMLMPHHIDMMTYLRELLASVDDLCYYDQQR